ncbi:hypothetical protein Cch01nite_07890 [Cellulomonas chitinilytica]|uniref:Uncharacterized protein n=1 Tax=Cellulomonas chitinilytica TaxID=398759 RepID=A0A919NZU5_9CELL|nr:hypothetical protein [Cellulomonas chitinilytica]GIG20065.1 hypothetical protein Cch01nite_07890 [Cellulomonas chitinilytica]
MPTPSAASSPPSVEPTVPAPRWGESSAPATGLGAAPFGEPAAAGAARPVDDFDDEDDEDDDDLRPKHPYTWLHLIVLALVAFVLGFLITLLLTKEEPTDGSQGAAAVAPVTTTSSPASGPL